MRISALWHVKARLVAFLAGHTVNRSHVTVVTVFAVSGFHRVVVSWIRLAAKMVTAGPAFEP
jgi:hypothetical protein